MSHLIDLIELIERRESATLEQALELFASAHAGLSEGAAGRSVAALVGVLTTREAAGEQRAALAALVNLSGEATFEAASAAHADALVHALMPLVSQRLKEAARAPVRRLASTLLANLSTLDVHSEALCGAPLRLKRLLALCTAVAADDDSLEHVAVVLQNCSRHASLRAVLLLDDAAPLVALAASLPRGSPVRRRGVAHTVRNVFVDEHSRRALVAPRAVLAPLLAVCAAGERDAAVLGAVVDVAFLLTHASDASKTLLRELRADDALRALFEPPAAPLEPTTADRAAFVIRELTKPQFIFAPDALAPIGPQPGRVESAATAAPQNDMDVLD